MPVLTHKVAAKLLDRPIKVTLVGAGGTGSRIFERLVALQRGLLAMGHPYGLAVQVIDDDIVSPANVGRQAFAECDIGCPKAHVLVNRANLTVPGLSWSAHHARLQTGSTLDSDFVIGAVDSRAGRLAILRNLERNLSGMRYWLDCGNTAWTGQVVLGQVLATRSDKDKLDRLPHAGELFGELIDAAADKTDDEPSCSLRQALQRQSLFINQTMADYAANLLWMLLTKGELRVHGAFINMESMFTSPLPVDPDVWARLGVQRDGVRRKVQQPSRTKQKLAA